MRFESDRKFSRCDHAEFRSQVGGSTCGTAPVSLRKRPDSTMLRNQCPLVSTRQFFVSKPSIQRILKPSARQRPAQKKVCAWSLANRPQVAAAWIVRGIHHAM